ncbi:MAG: transporter substrate-binding domain-containing protein [Burkholderiales bacterium]|nr:transporter substrate-binding domain-containing protein [Burkholderiales bacterium]
MAAFAITLAAHADALREATIRIGFSTNKPPYVFEHEKSGLEYDIIVAAVRHAGYETVPFFAPMSRLSVMLAHKDIDGIATTNTMNGVAAYYSAPYITYHNVAIALASRHLEIKSIADLGRYSVSTFQRAAELLGPAFHEMAMHNPAYREEADQSARNRLLYSGHVDVIVGDSRIVAYFNREAGKVVDTTQRIDRFDIFPPTDYSVGFVSEAVRDMFNEGLARIREDGEYAEIERRYAEYQ